MSNKFVKNNNLTKAMKEAEKDGFHPKIGKKTGAEVTVAHELGHCLAGGFYGEGTDICERRRSERRANIFAYRLLVETHHPGVF